MSSRMRVLLADNYPVFLKGLRLILADDRDMCVVGEAATSDQVQSACRQLQPDILLLDLAMLGPQATEVLISLRRHQPDLKIVVLTAITDEAWVRAMIRLGAAGYVLKHESPMTILSAIHAVAAGGTWLSNSALCQLASATPSSAHVKDLADRDYHLLMLLSSGKRTAEMANILNLGAQTVSNYLGDLYTKIGVSNRTAAVAWARQRGIV